METLFLYLVKSSLLLALSMALFLPLMINETFHRFNRFLILVIAVLSLLLPMVNIGMDTPFSKVGVAIENMFGIGTAVADVTEIAMDTHLPLKTNNTVQLAVVHEISVFDTLTPLDYFTIIYFAVAITLLLRLLYMYICVIYIMKKCKREINTPYELCNAVLLIHNGKEKPFSWFWWIVCSKADLSDGGREIIAHEMAHVRKMHSFDILFIDSLIILQWFNPMAWIMKSVLKDIHEYEADEAVIADGTDVKHYQLLIIKKAVGARLYSIANSFNHSLTKKRITMMCKKKSSSWRCAKALYIVPVAAIVACSFSSEEGVDNSGNKVNEIVVNANKASAKKMNEGNTPAQEEQTYMVVEEQPEYPGGMNELMKYLQKSIKYPEDSRKNGSQGRAFVRFIVEKDGSVTNAEIMKSSGDTSLDAEAVRVVESMPKWKPGKQGGEVVRVRFVLPVAFILQNNIDEEMKERAVLSITDVNNTTGDVRVTEYVGGLKVSYDKKVQDSKKTMVGLDEKVAKAEYPGGWKELVRFLNNITCYPKEAQTVGLQGDVFVEFDVNENGVVNNVRALKASLFSNDSIKKLNSQHARMLSDEAVRVVSAMPRWVVNNPDNLPVVPISCSLPIRFRK